jgi:uncharacterized protein
VDAGGAPWSVRGVTVEPTLTQAAYSGDLAAVKRHLAAGADPSAPDTFFKLPPLRKASTAEVVAALLAAGADPNGLGPDDSFTPLMVARDAEIATLLLAAGADPNRKNNDGYTALMLAAYDGDVERVRALLDGGADPNLRSDGAGLSPLGQALEDNELAVVELLVARGCDVAAANAAYEDLTGESLLETCSPEARAILERAPG